MYACVIQNCFFFKGLLTHKARHKSCFLGTVGDRFQHIALCLCINSDIQMSSRDPPFPAALFVFGVDFACLVKSSRRPHHSSDAVPRKMGDTCASFLTGKFSYNHWTVYPALLLLKSRAFHHYCNLPSATRQMIHYVRFYLT